MLEENIRFEERVPVRVGGNIIKPRIDKTEIGVSTAIHIHKEYELLIPISGKIRCTTTDNEFIMSPGDILFVNSYTPHATYNETEDAQHYFLQFNQPIFIDASLRYIARFSKTTDTPAYLLKSGTDEHRELSNCINRIVNENKARNPFWNEYVQADIFMIIAILHRNGVLRDTLRLKSAELTKIKPAIDFISENYSKELSTATLSKILSFNESYFCRLFKKSVGTSAMEYINFVRICKAEKMLRKNMSISEISTETGFSSISYFNRVFKKYNHYSPREFRKILNNTTFDYPDIFT